MVKLCKITVFGPIYDFKSKISNSGTRFDVHETRLNGEMGFDDIPRNLDAKIDPEALFTC